MSVLFSLLVFQTGCQKKEEINQFENSQAAHSNVLLDDHESEANDLFSLNLRCRKATREQIKPVNQGYKKLDAFLEKCYHEAGSEKWCNQIVRPNPESLNTFYCTYSEDQPHFFVHPDQSTWDNAINAVKLVLELESKNVPVEMIYNWWRPEPYNKNVGGAAGRHPEATSVDVRFPTKADQNKAHKYLCQWRKQGRLRALGYYSGTGLHLGMDDRNNNTWGKSCP